MQMCKISMRRYITMDSDDDKSVCIDRVRSFVLDAEKDPIKQKTVLRLEAMPKFTKDLDKGKGVVFDFDLNSEAQTKDDDGGKEKLMGSAIRANKMANSFQQCEERDLREALSRSRLEGSFSTTSDPKMIVPVKTVQKQTSSLLVGHSTEYGSTSSEARPSEGPQNSTKIRRRPYIRKRQEQKKPSANILRELYGSEAAKERSGVKRKGVGEVFSEEEIARRKEARVIPHVGSSTS